MSANNFKLLMSEEESRFDQPPPRIGHNLHRTTGLFSFAANVFEIFLPKVVDIFVAMSGGEEGSDKDGSGKYAPNRGPFQSGR